MSFCYKSNKCPLDLHSPAEALSLKVPAILLAYNATEE
nr:MAG TPA: Polysaccharide pyruvyl transferase [Caudoviricetes sp.]